jgi:hypothetical protein
MEKGELRQGEMGMNQKYCRITYYANMGISAAIRECPFCSNMGVSNPQHWSIHF